MKIKMLTGQAGPDYVRNIGDVVTVGENLTKKEAVALVESGQAELVKDTKIEKATAKKPKKK